MPRETLGAYDRLRPYFTRAIGAGTLAVVLSLQPPEAIEPTTVQAVEIAETPTPQAETYQLYGSELHEVYDGTFTRDTGMDMQSCTEYKVCGTDLGQPFLMPDGRVAYLFGDTFQVPGPFIHEKLPQGDYYRAQTMLISSETPTEGAPIHFDGAGAEQEDGSAGEILGGKHMLLNDGVSLPNGNIVVSYQHTYDVKNGDNSWYTDYSSLAVSHDGGQTFEKLDVKWQNDPEGKNNDPYQMWSMQLDGDYVYVVSVCSGRRPGDMMMMRVPWQQMADKDAYEYLNDHEWGGEADAKPVATGHFGEPSMRKLSDGTWILSYADYRGHPKLVTRTLEDPTTGPSGEWNAPKIQLTNKQLANLYGGGIHPYSTADNLIMMVSTWQTSGRGKDMSERQLKRYDVSHYITTAN